VTDSPARVLDCRGQRCPVPVIELAKALPTVAVGDVIEVLSDDPAAAADIPAWCRMRGQSFEGGGTSSYRVRRLS
jgi:tRNA 2-thiouridine synthesizing protein A